MPKAVQFVSSDVPQGAVIVPLLSKLKNHTWVFECIGVPRHVPTIHSGRCAGGAASDRLLGTVAAVRSGIGRLGGWMQHKAGTALGMPGCARAMNGVTRRDFADTQTGRARTVD